MSLKTIGALLEKGIEDEREITEICVDGRLCKTGSLYVALKGKKSDGHLFLSQAKQQEAIAAIVEEEYQGEDFGLTLIRVKDPLQALHKMASSMIKTRKPLIIGITGSIGKTTVKEFIATLLETTYKVSKTPHSYNGQIGLPLTILNADPEAEVLVLEMGISQKQEMSTLVSIAAPHLAIMTRITPAHLGNFSSLEEIAEEKSQIFSKENLRQAFIHSANQKFSAIDKPSPFKKVFYGSDIGDYVLKHSEGKVYFMDQQGNESVRFELPFTERHLVENFFIAALVAKHLHVRDEEIQERAYVLKPFKHRFEKFSLTSHPQTLVIDDSYNNNPIALKTSLQNLPKPQQTRKTIAVLGEMRELGLMSQMAHIEAALVALPIVDVLICYGEETKPLYEMFQRSEKPAYHSYDKEEVKKILLNHIEDGDVVLIKGANSNKLWEILESMTCKELEKL
jgi:UDP-N-acetylmuramoyl-tripeptide--D-alanyl-D-alanine ligase